MNDTLIYLSLEANLAPCATNSAVVNYTSLALGYLGNPGQKGGHPGGRWRPRVPEETCAGRSSARCQANGEAVPSNSGRFWGGTSPVTYKFVKAARLDEPPGSCSYYFFFHYQTLNLRSSTALPLLMASSPPLSKQGTSCRLIHSRLRAGAPYRTFP